MKKKNKKR